MQYNFQTISPYCIKLENYTVAKVKVCGKWLFEVWNVNQYITKFELPEEAKQYVIQKVKNNHDFKGDKHE